MAAGVVLAPAAGEEETDAAPAPLPEPPPPPAGAEEGAEEGEAAEEGDTPGDTTLGDFVTEMETEMEGVLDAVGVLDEPFDGVMEGVLLTVPVTDTEGVLLADGTDLVTDGVLLTAAAAEAEGEAGTPLEAEADAVLPLEPDAAALDGETALDADADTPALLGDGDAVPTLDFVREAEAAPAFEGEGVLETAVGVDLVGVPVTSFRRRLVAGAADTSHATVDSVRMQAMVQVSPSQPGGADCTQEHTQPHMTSENKGMTHDWRAHDGGPQPSRRSPSLRHLQQEGW